MKTSQRYRSGLISSLNPRHFNNERWSYTIHRITGAVLVFYLTAHLYETLQIGLGQRSWESALSLLHKLGPLENVGLWIVVGSVLYHGGNGIRLIINEAFGMILGKPTLPVYPYAPTSLGRNQKLAMLTINLVAMLLWIWAGLYLLAGLGLMK